MSPQDFLQEQFLGGILMLIDGFVANLVGELGLSQVQAEQVALEVLNATAKAYEES